MTEVFPAMKRVGEILHRTRFFFEGIKAAGFDVVRIPVAYSHQFEDAATYKIKSAWMDRWRLP